MNVKRFVFLAVCALLVGVWEIFIRPFLPEPFTFFSWTIVSLLGILLFYGLPSSMMYGFAVGALIDSYALQLSIQSILLPLCVWGVFELSQRIFTNRSQYVYVVSAMFLRCALWLSLVMFRILFRSNGEDIRSSFFWMLVFDVIGTAAVFFLFVRLRRFRYRYGTRAE